MSKIGHILQIHEPIWRGNTVVFSYTVGDEQFKNSYDFPAAPQNPSSAIAQKLSHWVAIATSFGLFSVEYFDTIQCDFPLSKQDKEFFEKVIFNGFGEFRLVNNIDMNRKTQVLGSNEESAEQLPGVLAATKGPLLLNGGGKDGSVSAKLLTDADIDFTWFQRGAHAAQVNVVAAWQAPVFTVIRNLDPNRKNRAYKGHRPMSAAIAFLAILSAYLFGYSDVIASNEASANEGNLHKDGFTVNHQYSKSFEFEQNIQALLNTCGIPVHYFSLLRPLHELQIALLAADLPKPRLAAITSCNHGTRTGTWCLDCAKCAFVALVMTAADPAAAEKIWGDRGVINRPGLQPYLRALLDPEMDKPLECVGTLAECQMAAGMILDKHDDVLVPATRELLATFAVQDKAATTDFLASLGEHAIPDEYHPVIAAMTARLAS